MCQFPINIPEPETEEVQFVVQQYPQILDWFILEGGEHDEESLGQVELHEVRLNDISYFIGFPTCYQETYYKYLSEEGKRDECVVEIAALAAQGAPYSIEFLETLVKPVQVFSDNHFIEIDVIDDLDGMVWVCRRFTEEQLKSNDFHNMMSDFVTIAQKTHTAIFSDGH
jgi:hypothetical protein